MAAPGQRDSERPPSSLRAGPWVSLGWGPPVPGGEAAPGGGGPPETASFSGGQRRVDGDVL